MNETIRAKMVLHEKDWTSYLNQEEKDLVVHIWKADNKDLEVLKKEYPDLCFILGLKKIVSEMD
jgi:hypothetical protein